jgi:hypothetical protein
MDPQPPPAAAMIAICEDLVRSFRDRLPPVGTTPEEFDDRDAAAVALVLSLAPANGSEAALVAKYVIARSHAAHRLSLVKLYAPASEKATKLRTQGARFERRARLLRTRLLIMQEAHYYTPKAAFQAPRLAWDADREAGRGVGGGPAPQADAAVAPPGPPPEQNAEAVIASLAAPPAGAATKPAAPRRKPPVLRVIQGGVAS